MAYILKTHPSSGNTKIPDVIGLVVPGAGGQTDDLSGNKALMLRLRNSVDLPVLLTDDVHAPGQSTLVVNDGTSDLPQDQAVSAAQSAEQQPDMGALETVSFNQELDNENSGAAATINWSNGQKQLLTLTGNVALTLTAPPGVSNLMLRLVQDGTGGYNPMWPASVKWPGGSAPNFGVGGQGASGAVNLVALYYNGTDYYAVATLAFS